MAPGFQKWDPHKIALFMLGAAGLAHQEIVRAEADPWLVGAYLLMMSVPGVAELIAFFRRNGRQ